MVKVLLVLPLETNHQELLKPSEKLQREMENVHAPEREREGEGREREEWKEHLLEQERKRKKVSE